MVFKGLKTINTRNWSRLITTRFYSIKVDGYDNRNISLILNDNQLLQLNNVFLRDACTSEDSVDKYSRQKTFTTSEISSNLLIKNASIIHKDNQDYLQIEWNSRGKLHTSLYPQSFLYTYSSKLNRMKGKNFDHDKIYWDHDQIMKIEPKLQVNYHDYLNNQVNFNATLDNLNKYGLAFVNNCPKPSLNEMSESNTSQWPVAKLAEKFGYIKKTFYGTLFDVKNKKDAINIAYTKAFLPLHMDLLYYESPPGLQFLHSIKNSTLGGENVFADSFLAAQHVRETDPNAYYALTQVPVTFHYNNNGEHYYYQRPTIVENESYLQSKSYRPEIKEVNYSPPFQGPFEVGVAKCINHNHQEIGSGSHQASAGHYLFGDFLRGLSIFEKFINDPNNQYQVKIPEGTCVIFDNRRVLHSRLEFDDSNGGDRWLMGAYVDGDSFRSKLRVSKREIN